MRIATVATACWNLVMGISSKCLIYSSYRHQLWLPVTLTMFRAVLKEVGNNWKIRCVSKRKINKILRRRLPIKSTMEIDTYDTQDTITFKHFFFKQHNENIFNFFSSVNKSLTFSIEPHLQGLYNIYVCTIAGYCSRWISRSGYERHLLLDHKRIWNLVPYDLNTLEYTTIYFLIYMFNIYYIHNLQQLTTSSMIFIFFETRIYTL